MRGGTARQNKKTSLRGAGRAKARAVQMVDPATFTPHFSWKKSGSNSTTSESVRCEGISLSDLAEKAGTPAYVYSRAAIGDAYNEIVAGLGALPHTLCFAVKSNGNLAILKYLAGLGSGFDIVSGGELQHLQRIGVPGKRIVFSGVGKTREAMREALRYCSARRSGSRRVFLFYTEFGGELAAVLAGVDKPREEIREALRYCSARRSGSRGILLFNIESEAELEALLEESARERRHGAAVPEIGRASW